MVALLDFIKSKLGLTPDGTCAWPGVKGVCGRRATCWHPGRDVPVCKLHAPRARPGQVNPSPCCALTMVRDGNRWRCRCGFRWSKPR